MAKTTLGITGLKEIFSVMQIEYRNVLTKVEIYVSTRPPHLSHVNFSKIYILLS